MIKKVLSLYRYPEFIQILIWRKITPWLLRRKGVILGEKNNFFGRPIISMVPNSNISIASKVTLCSVSEYTALGVNHPVILRTLREEAAIRIGSDVGISGGSICAALSITVGNKCLIGANVTISDSDFHAIKSSNRRYNINVEDIAASPIVIGDNVFIGTGSIILKGVSIGDNSVIGAGSVVTKSFPKDSILAGNPARLIGHVQS